MVSLTNLLCQKKMKAHNGQNSILSFSNKNGRWLSFHSDIRSRAFPRKFKRPDAQREGGRHSLTCAISRARVRPALSCGSGFFVLILKPRMPPKPARSARKDEQRNGSSSRFHWKRRRIKERHSHAPTPNASLPGRPVSSLQYTTRAATTGTIRIFTLSPSTPTKPTAGAEGRAASLGLPAKGPSRKRQNSGPRPTTP